MPDDALVPVLAPQDVAAASPPGSGIASTARDRLAQDPVLDRLAIAVQLLERVGVPARLVGVVGEHELEGDVRADRAGPPR